jgi:primosomal protein N' (replication factor Y)
MHRVNVLLATALDKSLDYLAAAPLPPGTLVEVPLSGRKVAGVVLGEGNSEIAAAKLKPVARVAEIPPFSAQFLRFIDWVAEYTLAPRGAALALALPKLAFTRPRTAYVPPDYHPHLLPLTPPQHAAYKVLRAHHAPVQLLDGVTGSGKTEVYFHWMEEVLKSGRQVLVLLPEIALTHQWLMRFEESFGAPPLLWHSSVGDAARKRAWHAVTTGEAKVVVGARSALFLPFRNLGAMIVDEEHDLSYKQEEGVTYHARDMAVVRGKFESVPVLLVSATPALETMQNVALGRFAAVHLPGRHGAAGMPVLRAIDMRAHPPERGSFLSPILKDAIARTLVRGEQVMLFLNRRGYAPLLLCRACGHRFQCPDCSAWLVLHQKKVASGKPVLRSLGEGGWSVMGEESPATHHPPLATLQCHHCSHKEPPPPCCPACKAPPEKLVACGPGIERVAEEVRVISDTWRVIRKESPTTHHPPRITVLSSDETPDSATFADIISGSTDIIIGTQLLAKGHHFPHLTLIGVVDADMGLTGGDLRAGERTYHLLHQLSGRAGRMDSPGEVYLQTYAPAHPVITALLAGDRDGFMQAECAMREEGNWPPFGQLAAILLDGKHESQVRQAGLALLKTAPEDPRLTILGPAPAPLSRLKGQYRYRLLVKAGRTLNLQKTLRAWLQHARFAGVRVKLDINPYDFM